jgi:hypothetical protein
MPDSANAKISRRRTFELWILLVVVLGFMIIGWLRLYETLVYWEWLERLGVMPGPLYIAVSGGIWGLMGLASFTGLWFRRRWAACITYLVLFVYLGFYWLDYFLFVSSPTSKSNVIFTVAASLAAIILVVGVLAIPRQRRYFNE